MDVCVIGTGYVGLITGVGLAKLGHRVNCVDVDEAKVAAINSGIPPIYEDNLATMLSQVVGKTLVATTDLPSALKTAEVVFICVGTPSAKDDSMDVSYVQKAFTEAVGKLDHYAVIVVKSTVVPGTTESLIALAEKETGKQAGKEYGLCMNPEFLREGKALEDFFNPDRIVVGEWDSRSGDLLAKLYASFKCPLVRTTVRTAEMVKYASNAFLATKISFANEVGNLCKTLGIDFYEVADAIGMDKRIGRAFLNAGIGYGGSCFPKDVKALIHKGKESGAQMPILSAVVSTNDAQPLRLVELAKRKINLPGAKVAVLGLAFKPASDDIREAPSLKIIEALVSEGVQVTVYDPKAMVHARKILGTKVLYAASAQEALASANAVFLLTEWPEFRDEKLYAGKIVFDGRKVLNKKSDNVYEGICW
jgi:UDPglucose 6-dehydrogenase